MKKIKKYLKKEEAFTLLEMLIVIMIVSVLLLLVMSNLDGVNKTINETQNDGIIQTVRSQMLIYEMEKGEKPSAEYLEKADFITEKQLEAYNEAIESTPLSN